MAGRELKSVPRGTRLPSDPSYTAPRFRKNGRAGEIRTHDLLHPMQARYQATLRPENKRTVTKRQVGAGGKWFFLRLRLIGG